MAPNEDQSPYEAARPDSNPFIAFRRFADSQASNLFNTLLTLPAALNDTTNAHNRCLFGEGDPEQCTELMKLMKDADRAKMHMDKLLQVGDIQQFMEKGLELTTLIEKASDVSKDIMADDLELKELRERVGTEKGQQWGWSWSWEFPKPFDEGDLHARMEGCRSLHSEGCSRWNEQTMEDAKEVLKRLEGIWEARAKKNRDYLFSLVSDTAEPATLKPSTKPTGGSPRSLVMHLDPFANSTESYSPRALEDDKDLRKAGVQWRDAFEDLVRAERGGPLIPSEQLGQSRRINYNQWARRVWETEFPADSDVWSKTRRSNLDHLSEEPSYEYAHDHDDGHEEPPTPKTKQGGWSEGMSETELEAYERLLGLTPNSTSTDAATSPILSTLTTTERTIGPDGTVTTKVVFKKRFADGREESSETAHTQRGQSDNRENSQDVWKAVQEAQSPIRVALEDEKVKRTTEKKKGWFWSS